MLLAELDIKALFESADALALFLAFFIPGFLARKIYGLIIATGDQDFGKLLPEVVAYSAIHYAVFGWLIFLPVNPFWHAVLAYVVVLVLPIVEGPAVLLARDWNRYRRLLNPVKALRMMQRPDPTPWDTIFSGQTPVMLRIRLKNDKWVGGIMGENSLSSTYPNPEQLYISQAFDFDDSGEMEVSSLADNGDKGILVSGAEISYIEISAVENEPSPAEDRPTPVEIEPSPS